MAYCLLNKTGKVFRHLKIKSYLLCCGFKCRNLNFILPLRRPNGQACLDTKEFNILSNMMQAVNEERYDEAGKLDCIQ